MKKKKEVTAVMTRVPQVITIALVVYNMGYLFGEYLAGVTIAHLSWGSMWKSIGLACLILAIRLKGDIIQRFETFYQQQTRLTKAFIFIAGVVVGYLAFSILFVPVYQAGREFGKYLYNTYF